MLDKHVVPLIKPPLQGIARSCQRRSLKPDQVTLVGFGFGLVGIALIAGGFAQVALVFLLLNRLADGVDGELARLQALPGSAKNQPVNEAGQGSADGGSDAGGYLDITLDFVFYALFPLGFALADPAANALPAAILIASFVGTGASFLAFSSLAAKNNLVHPEFSYKSLFYLNGLAEGTETVLVFVLMCLFPAQFGLIAVFFAVVCGITTINRVTFGYLTLRNQKPVLTESSAESNKVTGAQLSTQKLTDNDQNEH